jgi:putative acetyltransferase
VELKVSTHIIATPPDAPEAMALIAELTEVLSQDYPPESRHGFSVEKLIREGVPFFVLWHDGAPAGCGGVKLVDGAFAEVKRMYIRPAYRGLGLAKLMLRHLIAHAQGHGYSVIRLETGIFQKEAIALYERFGFTRIAPFPPYWDDPVSVCYELRLDDSPAEGAPPAP